MAGAAASARSPGRRRLGAGRRGRDRPAGQVRELDLALPGRANRSNAVVALAVADRFGISVDQALPLLRQVTSVAGRYTQVNQMGNNFS